MKIAELKKELANHCIYKDTSYVDFILEPPSNFDFYGRNKLIRRIAAKSENFSDFFERFLSEPALRYTVKARILIENVDPQMLWKHIRSAFGDKCSKTTSERGALKIGNESFSIFIQNGRGDGITRYCVCENEPEFTGLFKDAPTCFELLKPAYIYSYDCGTDIDREIPAGSYMAHSYDGLVLLFKY